MEVLITVFIVGLILGYCILHPIKSVKYLLLLIAIMVLGLIGCGILFSIPWIMMQI